MKSGSCRSKNIVTYRQIKDEDMWLNFETDPCIKVNRNNLSHYNHHN